MTDIRNFRLIDRRLIVEHCTLRDDGTYDTTFTRSNEWKGILCEQLGLFSQRGSVVASQSIAINTACLSSDETFDLLEQVDAYNITQQTNANQLKYETEVSKLTARRAEIVAKAGGQGKKKLSQKLKSSKLSKFLTELAAEMEAWQAKDLPKDFFSAIFTTIPESATQDILRDIINGRRSIAEAVVYGNDLKAQVFHHLPKSPTYDSNYITCLKSRSLMLQNNNLTCICV
jgi:hypothetical protein